MDKNLKMAKSAACLDRLMAQQIRADFAPAAGVVQKEGPIEVLERSTIK